VYVTNETIGPLILNHSWDRSAWDLANRYLLSVGANLLGNELEGVVRTSIGCSAALIANDIVLTAAHLLGARSTR
jgi:hypothetical protein